MTVLKNLVLACPKMLKTTSGVKIDRHRYRRVFTAVKKH